MSYTLNVCCSLKSKQQRQLSEVITFLQIPYMNLLAQIVLHVYLAEAFRNEEKCLIFVIISDDQVLGHEYLWLDQLDYLLHYKLVPRKDWILDDGRSQNMIHYPRLQRR